MNQSKVESFQIKMDSIKFFFTVHRKIHGNIIKNHDI